MSRNSAKNATAQTEPANNITPEPANTGTQAAKEQPAVTGDQEETETAKGTNVEPEKGADTPRADELQASVNAQGKKPEVTEEHPNPAREASDKAEEEFEGLNTKEKVHAYIGKVLEGKLKELSGETTPTIAAQKLMDQLQVNEIHENSKGEYFTELTFAHLSEGGKKDLVKTYKR